MEHAAFERWLETFGRAWTTNDPEIVGSLVPESEFAWHGPPWREVFRTRKIFVDHWVDSVRTQSNVETRYEIIGVVGERGICNFHASFIDKKTARGEEDALYIVTLDEAGRCAEFREWVHSQTTVLDAYR